MTEPVGSKTVKQKRGYQIQYGVQIDSYIGGAENSLYVWVPKVYQGIVQGNMENTQDTEPYWDTFRGVYVYLFQNLEPFNRYSVSQTFWFERYSLETQINPRKITNEYTNTKLFTTFTEPDVFVPSDNDKIATLGGKIVGRERNPYYKAKAVYDYVLQTYSYSEDPAERDVIKSIDTKEADSYIYSILYAALLRSSGVPCRPIAGYLVYGNKNTKRHYWNEFYIDGFGWVPVDCTLGDKVRFDDVPHTDQDVTEYYFGNIDNQHIIFSRGIIPTMQILPDGNAVRKNRMYSFQNIYEEASRSVTSYRAVWSDINIIDWW
jgi:transglutaminase-like putative cysteine protease